jgi:hypothetical protein
MDGLTITEIAQKLNITYLTAKQRLLRARIKPLTKEAIYPKDAIERIKNVAMGRPKKAAGQEPEKSRTSKARAAKQPAKAKKYMIPRR